MGNDHPNNKGNSDENLMQLYPSLSHHQSPKSLSSSSIAQIPLDHHNNNNYYGNPSDKLRYQSMNGIGIPQNHQEMSNITTPKETDNPKSVFEKCSLINSSGGIVYNNDHEKKFVSENAIAPNALKILNTAKPKYNDEDDIERNIYKELNKTISFVEKVLNYKAIQDIPVLMNNTMTTISIPDIFNNINKSYDIINKSSSFNNNEGLSYFGLANNISQAIFLEKSTLAMINIDDVEYLSSDRPKLSMASTVSFGRNNNISPRNMFPINSLDELMLQNEQNNKEQNHIHFQDMTSHHTSHAQEDKSIQFNSMRNSISNNQTGDINNDQDIISTDRSSRVKFDLKQHEISTKVYKKIMSPKLSTDEGSNHTVVSSKLSSPKPVKHKKDPLKSTKTNIIAISLASPKKFRETKDSKFGETSFKFTKGRGINLFKLKSKQANNVNQNSNHETKKFDSPRGSYYQIHKINSVEKALTSRSNSPKFPKYTTEYTSAKKQVDSLNSSTKLQSTSNHSTRKILTNEEKNTQFKKIMDENKWDKLKRGPTNNMASHQTENNQVHRILKNKHTYSLDSNEVAKKLMQKSEQQQYQESQEQQYQYQQYEQLQAQQQQKYAHVNDPFIEETLSSFTNTANFSSAQINFNSTQGNFSTAPVNLDPEPYEEQKSPIRFQIDLSAYLKKK